MQTLWEQLKFLRKQAGLTQQKLAELTGNSRQEISMMENNRFHGGFDKVERVFLHFGHSLKPQKEGLSPALPGEPLESIRILAIDDDPEILQGYKQTFEPKKQRGISSLLEILHQVNTAPVSREGFQLDTATSGEEGLKLVKRAIENGTPYTLLFLDMRMPNGWDGMKSAHEIRQVDPDIRIIIISAYRDHTLQKMREEMGSNFVFHQKPYLQDELIQLSTFMAQEWQQARELHH